MLFSFVSGVTAFVVAFVVALTPPFFAADPSTLANSPTRVSFVVPPLPP
jgi:hypothetical protein